VVRRQGEVVIEGERGVEVPTSTGKVTGFSVDLAESHVQEGAGLCEGHAPCLGSGQGFLVEPSCFVQMARGEPHVGEHDGAAQCVGKVAGCEEAGHGMGECAYGHADVARRPGSQAQEPGGRTTRQVILRAGQVECVLGMLSGLRHPAPGLGQRGPIYGDGGRQGTQFVGVGPLRGGCGSQRVCGVVESCLRRAQVAGHHQHPAVEHAEHGTVADGVVGERAQPAHQQRVLPVAPNAWKCRLHQVGRTPEVSGGQGVADGAFDLAVGLVPAASCTRP
jgi:hypothetical protein